METVSPIPMVHEPTSKVTECRNATYKGKDVMSKSDPLVIVSMRFDNEGNWKEIGRTEMIKNDQNPKFSTPISLSYFFERLQRIKFEVFDVDNGIPAQSLGQSFQLLGQIASSGNQTITLSLSKDAKDPSPVVNPKEHKGHESTITIQLEEIQTQKKATFICELRAVHLDKKDMFGKSDPYLQIHKKAGGNWVKVFESKVIKKTLDPNWGQIQISTDVLCTGDPKTPLKVQVWDWDKVGSHDFIGEVECSLETILQHKEFELKNSAKAAKKKDYVNSGRVIFDNSVLEPEYSFLEYLKGGLEIKLMVAVDFTASNGNPNHPASLHFQHSQEPSEYRKALESVSSIIGQYSFDKRYLAYGFGCKLGGQFSNCFPLNFNDKDPNCFDIQGVIAAYQQALQYIELYGPTNFNEIIHQTVKEAKSPEYPEGRKYLLLLILTDGQITDMDKTKDALVEASKLPVSTVIVGVGNDNFDAMKELDADEVPLQNSKGEKCLRDIVQFVSFKNFVNRPKEELAASVLEEIPLQVTQYMKSKKMKPLPSVEGSPNPHYSPSSPLPSNLVTPSWPQVPLKDPLPSFCKNPTIIKYLGPYADASVDELKGIALELDRYGNPSSPMFDLGRNNAFGEFKILIGMFYVEDTFLKALTDTVIPALKNKGFNCTVVQRKESEFIQMLPQYDEAWIISNSTWNDGDSNTKDNFVKAVVNFHNKGGGLAIWGDNDPYFVQANAVLSEMFKMQLIGDTPGGKVLKAGKKDVTQEFGYHYTTCGVQLLYEGVTISYPNQSSDHFVVVGTSSDSHPVILYADNRPNGILPASNGRIVLDCAFTKLYVNWDTAGTERYIMNLAVWLLGIDNKLNNNLPLHPY